MADLIKWARDRKKNLSQLVDQVNPLDNGRTWQQRTPTNTRSVGQQITNSAPARAPGRVVDAAATAIRQPRLNLSDLIQDISDVGDANTEADRAARLAAQQPELYINQQKELGNTRPTDNMGQAFFNNTARLVNTGAGLIDETPATAKAAFGMITGNDQLVSEAVTELGEIQRENRKIDSGIGRAGTIYNSPTEQLNPLDTAKRFAPAYVGAVGETFPVPATKVIKGANLASKVAKVGLASGAANTAADAGLQLTETGQIDPMRSLQAAATGTLFGAAMPLGAKLAGAIVPNNVNALRDVGAAEGGMLNLDGKMDDLRARQQNPSAEPAPVAVDPNAQAVTMLTKKEVADQLVNDLGLSPQTANRLIEVNGKVDTAARLYGVKDNIRGADNADAYATTVINEAQAAGKQAAQQNMPSTRLSKDDYQQKYIELQESGLSPDDLKRELNLLEQQHTGGPAPRPMKAIEDRPANIDINGEVVEPTKTKAKNVDEFVKSLPEADKITRQQADQLEGEGADWMRKAGTEIDKTLKKNGDSFENWYRSIQQASDDVKNGVKPKVSATHQAIYDTVKPQLDALRKASGKETGETPYYLPRRPKNGGEMVPMGNSLVDSIDAATFGSAEKRTGRLGIEDTDMTPEGLASYAVQTIGERFRKTKAADDLMKAAEKRGKPITQEQANEAIAIQDNLLKDITKSAKDGKEMTSDTAGNLNKLAEAEGIEPEANDYKPGALLQSPKHMLKNAKVWERGFSQFDYSLANANTFLAMLKKNKVPDAQFADALKKSIKSQMPDADKDIVNKAIAGAVRRMEKDGVSVADSAGYVNGVIRTVAKEEMIKLGKTTAFTNPKMKQVISEQINGRVLKDIHETNFIQSLDSFITERVNVSLRGLNITSALFELGDIANIFSNYGVKNLQHTQGGIGPIKGDTLYFTHKYGQSNASFMTPDMPEVKALNKIWSDPKTSVTKKMYESYRTGENKLLIFRYVEQHKTELFFRTADKYYKQKGLSGNELVKAVMDDYDTTMLPHSLATANRVVGKFPKATTQYLNWSLQATKRLGRTVSGRNTAGRFESMSTPGRIGRGVATELLPKTAAAALIGVPMMQILGMKDFTGITTGDFTGVEDEDKNTLDQIVKYMSLSPILGVGSNFYFANRRNQIADANKAKGETYKSERQKEDTPIEVAKQSASMLVPFRTQAQKTKDVLDSTSTDIPDVNLPKVKIGKVEVGGQNITGENRGYFENRQGRIQTTAPKGVKAIPGAIFGKQYTKEMRDYQDNPNIATVIAGKAKPLDIVKKNDSVNQVSQTILNQSQRDFNRPLSASITDKDKKVVAKGYSDSAKEAHAVAIKKYGANSKEANKVVADWVKNGQEYNKLTDNLKKNNKVAYESWLKTKDGDVLTPEKWRVYGSNPDIFAFEKKRKQLEKRDLGRKIDPIYELQPDRANMVLQERSVATGDDMTLRAKLYKEDWYKGKFKDDEQAYFNSFEGERDDSGKSQRVKDWNAMNTQLFNPEKGVIKKYGLVEQYQKGLEQFADYNSQERKDYTKAWYNANGDAYTAQKDAYDQERYAIVNKMRKLENVGEISFDVFKGKLEFPSDDTNSSGSYAKGSGGGRGGSRGSSGGGDSFSLAGIKVNDDDFSPKGVKVKKVSAGGAPKLKKFAVTKVPTSYTKRKLR